MKTPAASPKAIDFSLTGLKPGTTVYAIFGVCRSGTTAIEKLLALSGLPAFHQPIKSSLVRGIHSVNLGKYLPSGPASTSLVIKETLGFYSEVSSTFNPFGIISKAVPRDKLKVVFTIKEPFHNFLSWIKMEKMVPSIGREPLAIPELFQYYLLACKTLYSMIEESRDLGFEVIIFDYASLRRADGDVVARDLLHDLGLDPKNYSSANWAEQSSVLNPDSGIIRVIPRMRDPLHDQLDASLGFKYYEPDESLLPDTMRKSVLGQLKNSGVIDSYLRYSNKSADVR